jgi:hypothetical protein
LSQKLIKVSISIFKGLIYLTVQYPLDLYHDEETCDELEKSKTHEIIENLHLICLKLMQELLFSDKSKNKNEQQIKILNYNQLMSIEKYFSNYMRNNEKNYNLKFLNESLDKLAQYLQLCFFKDSLQFTKFDVKHLFEKYVKIANNESFFMLIF